MALSKIDVANMLTGATPVANGGTALTSGFQNGVNPRPLSKPLVINSDMAVAQRSTSASSISTSGYHSVDRFRYSNSSSAVVVTISQETLSSGNAYLNGFHNAMKLDCTTADTSIASGHLTAMQYKLEAQDCTVFRKGTANAQKMTVAFWFKATKTGTYILQLGDSDNNRKICKSYTVSSTDTWEHKVLVLDMETSNAMNDDNGSGFVLTWFLVAGSDYSGGTLATSWEATEWNSNSAVGQVNAFDSTSNNVHITGVQLEVGEYTSSTLPPFQFESYGDNLKRCERYCIQLDHDMSSGNETQVGIGWAYNTASAYAFKDFPVQMRTQPTMSSADGDGTNFYRIHTGNSASNFEELAFASASKRGYWIAKTGLSSLTANQIHTVEMLHSNAYVRADAEL